MNNTNAPTGVPPDEMWAPKVEFTGEQDGHPEQMLKDDLKKLFLQNKCVRKAYLANVIILNKDTVAICLKTNANTEDDKQLLMGISSVFKRMFNTNQSLDILFLKPGQESEVEQVCRPFYNIE